MPEEKTPSPTLNEEAAKQGESSQQQPDPQQSLADLAKLLEDAGIDNPNQLAGTIENASQYGHISNLLKEERDRSAQLQRQLAEMQTARPKQPQSFDNFDPDAFNSGETIDLAKIAEQGARRGVRSEWDRIQQENAQRQEMAVKQYNKIRQDNLYGKVGPLFEKKMQDPTFAYEVQAGLRDPVDEYRALKDQFYQNVIKQAHGTITQLQGGGQTPQQTGAPHVETGERTGNIVSEEKSQTDKEKVLERARSTVKERGMLDDQDELALIDSIFPDPL